MKTASDRYAFDPFPLGAICHKDVPTRFRVWAPHARQIALKILDPRPTLLAMQPEGAGYYEASVEDLQPGTRYFYRLNDAVDRPDPASRFQPAGVHGPSALTSRDFSWTDSLWRGRPWEEYVIYEAHVGTFTPAGTFQAMVAHLAELASLGVTALELMPVAQFPGERNWGYDGVHPFAPQNTYGGPEGLKSLVDACHARSLAVVLDVVYNHLGPEGNYLQEFGPYFTDRHRTPWGAAINYDGPLSDPVRDFFIGNALYWLSEFHIDALRLDATHAIFDESARPLLAELADAVRACGERLNRRGERLGRLVGFEELKLSAAATILSPAIPLLFMGEEYDATAPFLYFTSHIDPGLAAAVRAGREKEFADFEWHGAPSDPQSPETFARSRLTRSLAQGGHHAVLWKYYQELLRLRRELPAIQQAARELDGILVLKDEGVFVAHRRADATHICVCMNFGQQPVNLATHVPTCTDWRIVLDSSDAQWLGPHSDGRSAWSSPAPLIVNAKSCLVLANGTTRDFARP